MLEVVNSQGRVRLQHDPYQHRELKHDEWTLNMNIRNLVTVEHWRLFKKHTEVHLKRKMRLSSSAHKINPETCSVHKI